MQYFIERGIFHLSQVVLKVDHNEIQEMQKFYQTKIIDKVPPGGIFTAKTANCTITAYKSGKILFQGAGSAQEAGRWGHSQAASKAGKTNMDKKGPIKRVAEKENLPANIGSLSLIGSDEVGTGDYFGPITVVAAYVKKEDIPLLQELGVKDSKNLTDEKIIEIAKQIKEVIPYSLLTLQNEKYNKLQKSGMTQGKMKALLHNKAIGHVLQKISPEKPDAILIDQFAKREIYYGHLRGQKEIHRENVYFTTKAEGIHLAVAAASILARYAFVRRFEDLSAQAGFTLPKGAGAGVDKAAARLIHEKGVGVLPTFAKVHFANTQKALRIAAKIRD